MFARIVLALIVVSLTCSGCGKKTPQANEDQPAPAQVLFNEIQELMSQDKPAEALGRLETALTEDVFQNDKSQIFAGILSITLQTGQIEEAVTRHLSMMQTEPELGSSGYRVIEQALSDGANNGIALDWSSKLLSSSIDNQTRSRAYIFRAHILLKDGKDSEAVDILNAAMEELDPNLCIHTYRSILGLFLSANKPDALESAISRIETLNREEIPEIIELTTSSRLRLLMAKEDWKGFAQMFSDKLSVLSDKEVESLIIASYKALKEKDPSTAEQICKAAVNARPPEERSFYTASRCWLNLNTAQNPALVPDCINTIRTAGLPDQKVYYIVHDPFYAVLNNNQPEKLKEMLTILTDIREELTSEQDSTAVNNMLLDGSFILKDYDTAISMLEQGIGGKDDAWRTSAVAKLKAHRAMDAGRPDEAINYFREFMNAISESMESETDPLTGMTYTKTWCLARNAKRIGDLLKEQGLKDQASSAYAEAGKHFEKAIKEFKEDSKEHAALTQEKAEIPAG